MIHRRKASFAVTKVLSGSAALHGTFVLLSSFSSCRHEAVLVPCSDPVDVDVLGHLRWSL